MGKSKIVSVRVSDVAKIAALEENGYTRVDTRASARSKAAYVFFKPSIEDDVVMGQLAGLFGTVGLGEIVVANNEDTLVKMMSGLNLKGGRRTTRGRRNRHRIKSRRSRK